MDWLIANLTEILTGFISGAGGLTAGLLGAYVAFGRRLGKIEQAVSFMSGQLSQLMSIKDQVDNEGRKNAVLNKSIEDVRRDVQRVGEIAREARSVALNHLTGS